jgi:hypothetical protein
LRCNGGPLFQSPSEGPSYDFSVLRQDQGAHSTKRTVLRCNGGPLFQSPSEGPPYDCGVMAAQGPPYDFSVLRQVQELLTRPFDILRRAQGGLLMSFGEKGPCCVVMAAQGPPYDFSVLRQAQELLTRSLRQAQGALLMSFGEKGPCCVVMAARSSRVLRKGRPTTSAYFDRFKNYSPAPSHPSTGSGRFVDVLRRKRTVLRCNGGPRAALRLQRTSTDSRTTHPPLRHPSTG